MKWLHSYFQCHSQPLNFYHFNMKHFLHTWAWTVLYLLQSWVARESSAWIIITKWVMNSGFMRKKYVWPDLITSFPSSSVVYDHHHHHQQSVVPRQTKHTLQKAESRGGFIIFIFYSQLSGWSCFITHTIMKRIFTFIHRIHSEKKHYTALTRLKHAQTVGEMNTTDHTRLLF